MLTEMLFEIIKVIVMVSITMSLTAIAMAAVFTRPCVTNSIYLMLCMITMATVCSHLFGEHTNTGTVASVMLLLNTAVYVAMYMLNKKLPQPKGNNR